MLQVSKRSKRLLAFLVGFMMIVSQSSYLSLNKVYAGTNDSNTSEIVYMLTDTLESGQNYIVASSNSGSVSILERSSESITSSKTEVVSDDNGQYIKDPSDSAVWRAVKGDGGTLLVNGDFVIGLDENGNLAVGKKDEGDTITWSYDKGNQQLYASGGDSPVYLVFAKGFEASDDGDSLSLFVESEIKTGQDEDTQTTRGPPEDEEAVVTEEETVAEDEEVAPETAANEGNTIGAPTNGKTVLVFTSDIHNSSDNKAADRLGAWLDNIASIYTGIDAIGFCGDMGSASASESQFWTYTQEVMNVVSQKGISNAVYTTGNHEFYNGKYDSTTNPVKNNYKKGEVGLTGSNYIIYCLGTDNWNNNSDNYPQSQIDDLIGDLNDLGNDKPIIVLTHYPLHYFGSSGGYYGMGGRSTVNADLVIDALNDAAADGKKIVLLWGHNHSVSDTHYDKVYGPGDSLEYANGKSKDINFFYAAAGCMSDSEYGNGSAFVKGKGLVVTIDSEQKLSFSYYDASGADVTEGGTFTEGTPIDATAIALSPKTLKVEAGSTESLTVTFTPSDTTNRKVTWSSSNSSVATVTSGKVTGVAPGTATITASYADGSLEDTCEVTVTRPAGQGVTPENGKKYVILAGDGYALTPEEAEEGYTNGSDGNQQFTYNGLAGEKYTVGEAVVPERLLWTFTESDDGSGYYIQSQDGGYLNGTYVPNNHDGYDGTLKLDDTSDVWTISSTTSDSKSAINILKSTNASQSDAGDKYLTHGNGNESAANIFTLRSEENATASMFYEYTEDGTYVENDPTIPDEPTPDDPTPAEGSIYKLTDQFVDGKDYLIVSSNKAGSANALNNPGGTSSGTSMGSTDVIIKNGDVDGDGTSDQYILAAKTSIVWTASANESRYNIKNGSDYLEGKSGEVKIFSEQQYADRGWIYSGNQLQHEGGNNTYKVYYDGGFKSTYNSTDSKVYLYEKITGGSVDPFGLDDPDDPTPADGIRYEEVNAFEDGQKYIIAVTKDDGSIYAIKNSSDDIASAAFDVSAASGDNPAFIRTDDTNVVWEYTSDGYLTNDGRYFYPTSSNGIMTYTSGRAISYANGKLSYETSSSGTYYVTCSNGSFGTSAEESEGAMIRLFAKAGSESDQPDDPTPAEGSVYKLADQMTDGKDYLIVSSDSAGSAYALTNPGGTSSGSDMGRTSVAVKNGDADGDGTSDKYITAEEANIVWTASANGDGFNITNSTDYLEGKSGEVKIFSEQQYADRGWTYVGNQLQHTGGKNTYTVYYDNGFTSTYDDTNNKVYLYEESDAEIHSHSYGELIEEVAATCAEGGVKAHYECAECHKLFVKDGEEYVETTAEELKIPAEHQYGELIEKKDATCTEEGVKAHYECAECQKLFVKDGEEYVETTAEDLKIPATGHDWNEGEITKAPTCTEKGIMTYTCKRCDETYTKDIAARGHVEGEWKITKQPTATAKGEKVKKCTRCGIVLKREIIPAKGVPKKVSGILLSTVVASGNNSLTFTWSGLKGADGYDVFLGRSSGNKSCALVKTLNGKTFKWTATGLKKKTSYKGYVKGFIMVDGSKKYVRTSPTVFAYTSGGDKKYTNAKSVKVKKTKVSIKVGKSFKIKASVIKVKKSKKLMGKGYGPKLRYISTNTKIATVNGSGKIIGKSKGKCTVYVYAINGARKAVAVTVK